MGEPSENIFLDGDVVWVKLGSSWWPGEVVGSEKLSPEILASFKRFPYAVVKFFQEDTYEYVRNAANIFKYNCSRKDEFIKKGMDKHRTNISSMEKFPGDVVKAEILTNGDPDILERSELTHTTTKKDRYGGLFGDTPKKTPNIKKGKGKLSISPKSLQRTPARKILKGNPDYKAHILIQGKIESMEQQPTPEKVTVTSPQSIALCQTPISTPGAGLYSCHACSFTTTRINVLVIHTKSHSGTYIPFTPIPKVTPKSKPAISKKKDKPVKVVFATPEKPLKPKNEGKTQGRKGRRRKREENSESVTDTQEKRQKTDKEIKSTLLADWSEGEDSDSESHSENEIKKDTLKQNEIEMNTPSTSRLSIEINTEIVEEKTDSVENNKAEKDNEETNNINVNIDKIDSNSCFDFREEEDWPVEKDIGRRIPRVKSDSESKCKNDVDFAREVAELLEQTTVPKLPTPPPLPNIKSPEKSCEKIENFPQREAEGAPPPRAIFKTKTFFRSRHSRSQDVIEKYIADQLKADISDTNGTEPSNIEEIDTPICDVKVAKLAPKIQLKKMKAEAQLREAKAKELVQTNNEPEISINVTALPKEVLVAEDEIVLGTKCKEASPLKELENTRTNTKSAVSIETKSPLKIHTKSPHKYEKSSVNENIFKKKKMSPFKTLDKPINQPDKPEQIQLAEKIECPQASQTHSQLKIKSPGKSQESTFKVDSTAHVREEIKFDQNPVLKTSEQLENDTIHVENFDAFDKTSTSISKIDDIKNPEILQNSIVTSDGEVDTKLLQADDQKHSEIAQNSVVKSPEEVCTTLLEIDEKEHSKNLQKSIDTGHGATSTALLQMDDSENPEITQKSVVTSHGEKCSSLLQVDDTKHPEITHNSIVSSNLETCTTLLQVDDSENTEIARRSVDTKEEFSPFKTIEKNIVKEDYSCQTMNDLTVCDPPNITPSAVDALLSISKANVMHSKISEDPPDDIFADDSKAIEHSVLTFSNEDNSVLNETLTKKDVQTSIKHLCPSESDLQIAETLLNLPSTVKSKEILQRKTDDAEIIIEGGKIVTRFEITPSISTQNESPSYESEIEKSKNLNAAESLVQMSKSMNFVSQSNSDNPASINTQQPLIEEPKNLDCTPQKSTQSSKLLKILEEPLNAKKPQYKLFTKDTDKIINFDVGKKITQSNNFKTTPQIQKIIIRRATSTTKSFVESKPKQELVIPRSNSTPAKEANNVSTYTETKTVDKTDPSAIMIQPKGKKQPSNVNSVQHVIPQTTIITSTGALVQKMNSNDIFDINSMPIVLSDEILTPESIENMSVVLSDGSIVSEMPQISPITTSLKRPSNTSVEKVEPPAKKPPPKIIIKSETRVQPNQTLIGKHAITPNILSRTQKFKTGQSTITVDNTGGRKIIITKADVRKKTELPNQSVVNTKNSKPTFTKLINQKPVFKSNSQKSLVANPVSPKQPTPKQVSPKSINLSPTISKPQMTKPAITTGGVRNEKFIILPATAANKTQKILMSPSAGKTQLLIPKPATSTQDRPAETGKIMIITNAQGAKSRLILTPEHEKLLFPQKNTPRTVHQPTLTLSQCTPIIRTTSQSVISKMKPVNVVPKPVVSVSKPVTSVYKSVASVSKPSVSTYRPATKSIVPTSKAFPPASQQTAISKPASAQTSNRVRVTSDISNKSQKIIKKVPPKEQIIILQQKSGPNIQLTQAQFEFLQKTGQIVQKSSKSQVETKSIIKKSAVGKHSLLPVSSAAASTPVPQQNIITQTIPTENRQTVQNLLIQAPTTMLLDSSTNFMEQVVETTAYSNTKLESIPPLPRIIESPKQQTPVSSADLDNLEDILPATAIARHQESNEVTFSQLEQQEVSSITTNQLNSNAQANLGDSQLLAVPGENFGGPPDSFYLCVEENGTLTPIDERPLILENNQLVPMTVPWPEPAPVQAPPRDILAAALANTDVFPGSIDPPDFRDLNANVAVHCHVSETSTTLNNPIMSTLEVPTSLADGPPPAADLDAVLGVTNPGVPTSLNLPITVTDPRIASAPISMPILDDGLPHSMPILTDVVEGNDLRVETQEDCERMHTETLIITPGSISSEEIPFQPTITVSNQDLPSLDVSTEITS